MSIESFDEMFQSDLANVLYLLLGAVGVLLLIACVNVSSLLLARAVEREHEYVVRASIGASRWAMIRSALTESLLLAGIALPVALGFAWAGLKATLMIVPAQTIPDEAVVTLNVPVLLVSMGLALAAVLLFGIAPAWQSANPRLAAMLGSAGRSAGNRGQRRLLGGFVVVEVALSVALLAVANLMVRSLLAVERVPVTFPPDHTLAMRIPLGRDRYPTPEKRVAFFRELLESVGRIPGVKAVTTDTSFPMMGAYGVQVEVPGKPADERYTDLHLVSADYQAVAQARLAEGHFIDQREVTDEAHEAVVTQHFVDRYFKGEPVLGKVVRFRGLESDLSRLEGTAFTIVGVIANPHDMSDLYSRGAVPLDIFLPWTVAPVGNILLVETALPATQVENSVRQAVYGIDKDQPVADMLTVRQLLDMYGYAGPRFSLALFGTFAGAALLLSVIGIYGVLSFVTSQRTQEIGIRMALGADRGRVMWMVLRQAGVLAGIGVAAGVPLALAAGQLARQQLVRTSQHDPVSILAAAVILPLMALAGTMIPARRAAAVEPARALCAE